MKIQYLIIVLCYDKETQDIPIGLRKLPPIHRGFVKGLNEAHLDQFLGKVKKCWTASSFSHEFDLTKMLCSNISFSNRRFD